MARCRCTYDSCWHLIQHLTLFQNQFLAVVEKLTTAVKYPLGKNAKGSKSNIECDTIILDGLSTSDTIPVNIIKNSDVFLQHEAQFQNIRRTIILFNESWFI